ncbi:MAG: SMI1/KNR4 family protein [Phycisphaeraceae bacterium]|nr:SMI1/KNR4 family protein [Phycisphaeraceae bacterium]
MRLSPIGVFWKRLELSQNPRDPVRESLSLPIVLEPVPQFPAFPYIPLTDTEKARIRVEYEQREAEKAVAHSFLLPFIGKAALQRVEVGPPATRDQIEELEALTAHRLPRLYSDFLRTCGCLQAEGCEVFGTPPRRTPTYGALRCTRDRQQQQDMAWPKHLLVIGEDGRGGDYCLDLSKSDGQDCPVVYHDHELDNFENPSGISTPSIEIKSPSFEKWLKRVVRGQM